MQTALPVFRDDVTRHETLAAQTQAVERVIQTMHTHLQELLTLEDLASVAYLSPSHFHRVFHRLIGIAPGEFLSALRFQAARRLLLTTSLSVTDICFEVGYTSIGSFTSRFTQRSEEHTSELQSHSDLVCRLLLEKKKNNQINVQPVSSLA